MKFEVKNNQFHIDGNPTDSAMEIGIAIQKELKQGEAVLNHYRTDVNKLANIVELQTQYEIAREAYNQIRQQSKKSCCELKYSDSLPRMEFVLLHDLLKMAHHLYSASENWLTVTTVNDLPNPKDHPAVFVEWNNQILLIEIKNSTPKVMLEEFAQKGFRKWHPLIYPKK